MIRRPRQSRRHHSQLNLRRRPPWRGSLTRCCPRRRQPARRGVVCAAAHRGAAVGRGVELAAAHGRVLAVGLVAAAAAHRGVLQSRVLTAANQVKLGTAHPQLLADQVRETSLKLALPVRDLRAQHHLAVVPELGNRVPLSRVSIWSFLRTRFTSWMVKGCT
jgi:hypothetical protein